MDGWIKCMEKGFTKNGNVGARKEYSFAIVSKMEMALEDLSIYIIPWKML